MQWFIVYDFFQGKNNLADRNDGNSGIRHAGDHIVFIALRFWQCQP